MKNINQVFKLPYLYILIVLIGVSLKIYKLDQKFSGTMRLPQYSILQAFQ